MILRTDEIIYNILFEAKENEDSPLLEYFQIRYPSEQSLKESNAIFVGMVDSESVNEGYDFSEYRDLVEILIITKKRDYQEALAIIKTMSRYIVSLIKKNKAKFPNKPVIRNITPEYGNNFVLNRGHILVQVNTAPVDDEVLEDEELRICELLMGDIEYE